MEKNKAVKKRITVKKVLLLLFLFLNIAIVVAVLYNQTKREWLVKKIPEEREAAARAFEELLPGRMQEQSEILPGAHATVELTSNLYKSTGYYDRDNPPYYQWKDNITFYCAVDESFNTKTDKQKFDFLWDFSLSVNKEAGNIQSTYAPNYDGYFHPGDHYAWIYNVYVYGVHSERNVELVLQAGSDQYRYERSGAGWSSLYFTRNGQSIDPYSSAGKQQNTAKDVQAGKSSTSGSRRNWSKEMPDCDDYADYDDFMDDWDGNMPDGSDAGEYWDNW